MFSYETKVGTWHEAARAAGVKDVSELRRNVAYKGSLSVIFLIVCFSEKVA